jgi:glucarate dehydratase
VIQYGLSSEEKISEQNVGETILREIDEATRKSGSNIIQLYVGVFSPQKDIEIVRGIREKFGPNLQIGIDVNKTWSPKTAIKTINALQNCSLDYVEDATSEIAAMARVRSSVSVPFSTHSNNVYEIARIHAADIIAGDIHDCGGFLGARKLAAQCEGLNLGFWFHSSNELGISLAAMLHFMASSPHMVHPSQTIVGWLTDDIITRPHAFRDGMIELPNGPGLGVEIDHQKLEKYATLYAERGEFSPHDSDSRRPGWSPQLSSI